MRVFSDRAQRQITGRKISPLDSLHFHSEWSPLLSQFQMGTKKDFPFVFPLRKIAPFPLPLLQFLRFLRLLHGVPSFHGVPRVFVRSHLVLGRRTAREVTHSSPRRMSAALDRSRRWFSPAMWEGNLQPSTSLATKRRHAPAHYRKGRRPRRLTVIMWSGQGSCSHPWDPVPQRWERKPFRPR